MEKEFIPYEQALALKELGFDEPCFAFTIPNNENFIISQCQEYLGTEELMTQIPIYQQAFRWFREKYGYFTSPTESDDDISKKYDWLISKNLGESKMFIQFIGYRDSYEEAELECLKKLIEIVKEK